MKPTIVKVNEHGKVDMTLEEFELFIQEAYDEGKKDGTIINYPACPTYPAYPTYPTYIEPHYYNPNIPYCGGSGGTAKTYSSRDAINGGTY